MTKKQKQIIFIGIVVILFVGICTAKPFRQWGLTQDLIPTQKAVTDQNKSITQRNATHYADLIKELNRPQASGAKDDPFSKQIDLLNQYVVKNHILEKITDPNLDPTELNQILAEIDKHTNAIIKLSENQLAEYQKMVDKY